MKKSERIAALEARVAALEQEIQAMKAERVFPTWPTTWPLYVPPSLPAEPLAPGTPWSPTPIVTWCSGELSGPLTAPQNAQ
jgi:hypothetical protein